MNHCIGEAANEGEEINRESWLSLYDTVLLLTEEYLATKCELPKTSAFECKENSDEIKALEIIVAKQDSSEQNLKKAGLIPLKKGKLDDSSDEIEAGELFHEFLGENLPKERQADFKPMPKPVFKVCAMESNQLGCYADKTISLNQRIVLDAISGNPKSSFYLFLAMLLEYGRFYNDVLSEKKKQAAKNSGIDVGIGFMEEFMEYQDGKFFKESFEFADFTAPDAKGEKQKFVLGISGLGYDDRKLALDTLCLFGIDKGGLK